MMRIALATLAIIGMAITAPALGHSWYSSTGCCGGIDCRAVDAGELEFTTTDDGADAWLVVETGEVIPASQVRPSPDAQNHRCVYLGGYKRGMTRVAGRAGDRQYCLWIAAGSY